MTKRNSPAQKVAIGLMTKAKIDRAITTSNIMAMLLLRGIKV